MGCRNIWHHVIYLAVLLQFLSYKIFIQLDWAGTNKHLQIWFKVKVKTIWRKKKLYIFLFLYCIFLDITKTATPCKKKYKEMQSCHVWFKNTTRRVLNKTVCSMSPYSSLLYTFRTDWQIYYVDKPGMIYKFNQWFLKMCIQSTEITLPRGSCPCRWPHSCTQRNAASPHKPLRWRTKQRGRAETWGC